MILLSLTNITGMNVTDVVTDPLKALSGNWALIAGAVLLILVFLLIMIVMKNVIANAIAGIIALLIIKYVFGVAIPLSPLVLVVSILGGVGGVAALLIATFFGWL